MSLFRWVIACLLFCSPIFADPVITSISPTNGTITGGDVVTITGSGFTAATAVDFGFRPATSYIVITDNTISAVAPSGTAGNVDISVTAASQTSLPTPQGLYTYTKNSWDGIISGINQDAITLFDTETNIINGTIPLLSDSLASIITPDGTTIYAAHADIALVNVIDAATNVIIANIPTPVAGPGAFDIIVSPDGSRVYVSNLNSGYVTVIDTATNTVVTDVLTAPFLGALSITPDGKTVYVVSFALFNVTTIDTATNTVGVSIPIGPVPGMTAITPDGTKAYVASEGNNTITIIDVATNAVTGVIAFPAGSGTYGSFILPTGQTMYVANSFPATVSVVDLATNAIVDTIPLVPGSHPFWIVATPDSKTIYVINEATDDVTPIDVATNTAGANFAHIPGQIQDIVMSPDLAPVASFIVNLQPIGASSQFDASASLSPIGTISKYVWDFGDGETLVTNTPIINHTYMSSGPFIATLTVTNSAGTSLDKVFSSRFMSNNGGPTAKISQVINVNPFPPTNVRGFQISCRGRPANVIRWCPPAVGPSPVAYRIYRDASLTDLVATIPGNATLKFVDCNRIPGVVYTYYIVSVSLSGTVSTQVLVSIP